MAEITTMPRLSDTMEEGTVASWLKKVGDKISEGDILAEIETDKATMEFESFHEGTLLHIGVQEGETTKVDELLAIIGDEGEDVSALIASGATSAESTEEGSDDAATENTVAGSQEDTSSNVEVPEGVVVVTMPRLSDTMEEGTVANWLKKVGDVVEEGDILAEIETDKATMEFESFNSGTLLHVGLEEGQSAEVDSLLAIIGPAGTDVSAVAANFKVDVPKEEKTTLNKEASKPAPKAEAKKADPKKETKAAAPKAEAASTDLSKKTVAELKEMAKAQGITGYSSMKKAELVEALSK